MHLMLTAHRRKRNANFDKFTCRAGLHLKAETHERYTEYSPPRMSFRFHFGRPQAIAALLLLLFFAEALFVIGRAPLTESDYRYALCGREMWEKPSPALGYFTTCGNMQGDGTLAYRAAALPLSVYVPALRVQDWFAKRADARKPAAERTYVPNPTSGSVYDLRHQIVGLPYLLRVPFALAAVLLGAGLWWVSRRLFGNFGGFLSLAIYCVSPAVLSAATAPNNDILAAWGLYAVVYTSIGIAHAMYGPRRKWRPRIVLFTVALGLTACAHVLAAIVGFLFSAIFLLYVAERRRSAVLPLLVFSGLGALAIVFASYAFRLSPFFYIFSGGSARFTLSQLPPWIFFSAVAQWPLAIALLVALVAYAAWGRARYFGNTAPLAVGVCLMPLVTTQIVTMPMLWTLPFVLTFLGGVFADAFESKARKAYLLLATGVVATQGFILFLAIGKMHR